MKNSKTLNLMDEAAMGAVALQLSQVCVGGMVIYLQGPLGAGKTTFARHFLRGLGYNAKVKSPTFTIVEPYELDGREIFHFDLYRLNDPAELEQIGIYEYFTPLAICLIEWPDKGAGVLPPADIICDIAFSPAGRIMHIEGCSLQGAAIVARL